MKKLFLTALILSLTVSAYAGSMIMKPKPNIQDILTPDNPSWTGLEYNGSPILAGSDVIGNNVNYIYQIATITNVDMKVQVYLRAFAPSAYYAALANLNNTSALGDEGKVFQDSGIVFSRSAYLSIMKTPTTQDWSWQIILTYNVPQANIAQFNSDLSAWVVGKLPNKSSRGTTVYYWK